MQVTPRRRVIQGLDRGHHRNAERLRPLPQQRFLRRFAVAPVAGRERVEPVAEGVLQQAARGRAVGVCNQQAAVAAPQGQDAAGMRRRFLEAHRRFAFRGAQPALRDEPAEVGVTGAIGGEQDQG